MLSRKATRIAQYKVLCLAQGQIALQRNTCLAIRQAKSWRRTYNKQVNIPDNIQVMHAFINVGCLVAVLENINVATRIGRRTILGTRLKYTHT